MGWRVLFTTPRGIEDVVAEELRALGLPARPRAWGLPGWAWATVKAPLELARICYQARTIFRGMLVLAEGPVRRTPEGLRDIYELVHELDWTAWLPEGATFCVRTKRHGDHAYHTPDIERTAGQAIVDSIQRRAGRRQRVSLKEPDVSVRVDVNGPTAVVGLDFVGEEALHKRMFRPYDHPAALSAVLAAAMVWASGWLDEPERGLLDPMCGGGTLLMEAASLLRKIPAGHFRKGKFAFRLLPYFRERGVDFDALMAEWDAQIDWARTAPIRGSDVSPKHLEGARLNLEQARVLDTCELKLLDVEKLPEAGWVPEGGVGAIVVNPPFGVRSGTPRKARRLHGLLLKAADYALDARGTLVVITHRPEWLEAELDAYGFAVERRYAVLHGDLPADVLIVKRVDGASQAQEQEHEEG